MLASSAGGGDSAGRDAPGLLTVDVSNALTTLALWPHPGPSGTKDLGSASAPFERWQIASDRRRSADELRVLLAQLLEDRGLGPDAVGNCMAACVVPELSEVLAEACEALFGRRPCFLGPGLKSGLRIRTEQPRELGPDRIANAVAASQRYGIPVAVFDFSTTLTVDVVDAAGDYVGAIIAPGMEIASEALARRTARLGRVDLQAPDQALARSTEASLRSGLVYGYVGLVEGLAQRLSEEVPGCSLVATGEASWLPQLLTMIPVIDHFAPLLTLDGLRRIAARNPEALAAA